LGRQQKGDRPVGRRGDFEPGSSDSSFIRVKAASSPCSQPRLASAPVESGAAIQTNSSFGSPRSPHVNPAPKRARIAHRLLGRHAGSRRLASIWSMHRPNLIDCPRVEAWRALFRAPARVTSTISHLPQLGAPFSLIRRRTVSRSVRASSLRLRPRRHARHERD